MFKQATRFFKPVIELLLPPLCPLTHQRVEQDGLFSAEGWAQLQPITPPFCYRCGLGFGHDLAHENTLICAKCAESPPVFNHLRSALKYDSATRQSILAFKNGDQTHLALPYATLLHTAGAELLTPNTVLVPVPLHRLRLLNRRYNQSALLALALSKLCNAPVVPDALVRVRSTEKQGHKTRHGRFLNVAHAFNANPARLKALQGKHIVLVDDVATTCATLNACAKALKAEGIEDIDALTIARVDLAL